MAKRFFAYPEELPEGELLEVFLTFDTLTEELRAMDGGDLPFLGDNAAKFYNMYIQERLHTRGKKAQNIIHPTSKVFDTITDPFKSYRIGQKGAQVIPARSGKNNTLDISLGLTFEDLGKDKLTARDGRIIEAVSAIWDETDPAQGSYIFIPLSDILATMGQGTNPNARQKEKLAGELEKLTRVLIHIEEERTAGNGSTYKIEGNPPLINGYIISQKVTGNPAARGLLLKEYPEIMHYIKKRRQVTTVSADLLQVPGLILTETNISIQNYLIRRIREIKKLEELRDIAKSDPKASERLKSKAAKNPNNCIVLDTLYKDCGITETKAEQKAKEAGQQFTELGDKVRTVSNIKDQKARSKKNIDLILYRFRACGHIRSYKMDKSNIYIKI